MHRHRVCTLKGAVLDYWVARAANLPKPVIVIDRSAIECLVEVDGSVFEAFSPTSDRALADSLIADSGIKLSRVSTPVGPAWAAYTTSLQFVSTEWTTAALRAFVALRFGAFVADEVEA